ncbi:hypothetical protein Y032_0016g3150 [Ancylostoma ceylanicum]|uniref:Uncharacterized protein n=1 Tax=Ancylostoma ceylanicum TaxID=53326 RepID=A0A016V7B1_9BILA|nr:hypothetical protein Y032_0016g3150 [Ancylostoma ceylanicum]
MSLVDFVPGYADAVHGGASPLLEAKRNRRRNRRKRYTTIKRVSFKYLLSEVSNGVDGRLSHFTTFTVQ